MLLNALMTQGVPMNYLYRSRPFKLIPPREPYLAHRCRLHVASQWLVNSYKPLRYLSALTEGYTLAELLFFCLLLTHEVTSTKCRAGSCEPWRRSVTRAVFWEYGESRHTWERSFSRHLKKFHAEDRLIFLRWYIITPQTEPSDFPATSWWGTRSTS